MEYQFLKKRIKINEGFSYKPYNDQLGNLTIGYGHLIKKSEKKIFSKKLSRPYLNQVFEDDFKKAVKDFQKHLNKPKLKSRKSKELFLEMIFQIGIKGVLEFKKMIKQIEKKNKYLAALEMMDSLWYLQTPKRVENIVKNFLYK